MLDQGAIGRDCTPPAEAAARRRLVAVQRAGGIAPLPAAGARPRLPFPHQRTRKGFAMTTTAATAATPPVPNGGSRIVDIRLLRRIAIVLALAALADWLFYGRPLGISIVVFLLALDLGALLANPIHAARRDLLRVTAILVAAL